MELKNNLKHILLDKKQSLMSFAKSIPQPDRIKTFEAHYNALLLFANNDGSKNISGYYLMWSCFLLNKQPGDILEYREDSQ